MSRAHDRFGHCGKPASVGLEGKGGSEQRSEISVSIRRLTKQFDGTLALDTVDLDVVRGEFVSLLGPSGCGKTTLLRIIGGFEEPTRGEVLIAGRDVAGDPPYRRRTNMIFQHLALFPHMSVAENVAFGLEMKKIEQGAIDKKVASMLGLVRLMGFEDRRIDELSGGQKQRVAIARALVNDPEVLLLDEPLGALDLQLRLQMHDELKRIHREIGSTFILVTHDQTEAIALSDRIAVMEGGRIIQLGTPREIYDRPESPFVAQFVGQANMLQGHVVSCDTAGNCVFSTDDASFSGCADSPLSTGSKVLGVLRYENTELLPHDAPKGIPGTIADVTYLGSTTRIAVRAAGRTLVSELMSNDVPGGLAHDVPIRIHWKPEDLIVFGE